ncbi:MAG: hypothetical protein ACD_16C00082G0001, partial [uncultured bacterium]
ASYMEIGMLDFKGLDYFNLPVK